MLSPLIGTPHRHINVGKPFSANFLISYEKSKMQSKLKYTAAYCEENIWHLASDDRFSGLDAKVVLVTGPGSHRKLWYQRCSEHVALPVHWDYHVILLVRDDIWQVWDLDTTLELPVNASTYFRKTFRGPDESFKGASKNSDFFVSARKHRAENHSVQVLHEDSSTELTPQSREKCIFSGALDNSNVIFRAINSTEYIANFSSDRSHMRLPSGDWAAPPPSWSPIVKRESSNLMEWLDIESDEPGELLTLEQIIAFCSSPIEVNST
jgi:hypothetical protein